jgi:hypothetical protein
MNHPVRFHHAVSAIVVAALLGTTPPGVEAQDRPTQSQDSLRVEVLRLAALVDSLRAEVARLQAEGRETEAEDALATLRAAAEAAAAAGGVTPEVQGEQEFQGRQRSLQALNPEISLNADIFAHVATDDTDSENFFAREFELSIISNLDPFSRAKIFIGRHIEGGEIIPFGGHGHDGEPGGEEDAHADEEAHGGEFAVEEGYVEWVGLPGGLGLKLGRFFQQFGQVNRWHPHAFPFQSRPLPHMAFFGEDGLGQTGASVRWLAPFGGGAGAYEATLEVTTSENQSLFGESGAPTVLGHVNGFWQLSRSTDLDLGLSWVRGSYEDEDHSLDRSVFGAEMSFTWRPPERARYRGFNLRGGLLMLDGLIPHEEEPTPGEEPEEEEDGALGFWSWGELRLSQNWLVGARYEWSENPEDPHETAWLLSPTLTWWQSEYVRIRAEYDLLGRLQNDREGRFLLQVTFAMGPHKHESY